MSTDVPGEPAPVSVPLVRMLSRRPSSVEIWPGDPGRLQFYVHQMLREPVVMPVSNVVGFVAPIEGAVARTGVALVDYPIVPVLRNGRIGRPNLALVFREPPEIPRLRWGASTYTALPKERPQLDGVMFCAKKGFPVVEALERAGLTRYDTVFDALLACRRSTAEPAELEVLAGRAAARRREMKQNARLYMLALAIFLVARLGFARDGVLQLVLIFVAVALVFAVSRARRRHLRRPDS